MKDTILELCKKIYDFWSDSVQIRVLDIHDLPAKHAKYHRSYHTKFYNKSLALQIRGNSKWKENLNKSALKRIKPWMWRRNIQSVSSNQ